MNGDMGVPTIGSITIDPSDVTLDLVQGQPAPTQSFTVTYHPSSGDQDVTSQSTFALTDMTLGTMSANVFTAGTVHGGTTQLIATFVDPSGAQQTAIATIHVRVSATFNGPDCPAGGCPQFPPDNAPQCMQTNVTPQIFYPPDGVLLPPNMEKMAVQWTPFPGGPPAVPITEFEIDFKNANTDVRVLDALQESALRFVSLVDEHDGPRDRRLLPRALRHHVVERLGLHRQVESRR